MNSLTQFKDWMCSFVNADLEPSEGKKCRSSLSLTECMCEFPVDSGGRSCKGSFGRDTLGAVNASLNSEVVDLLTAVLLQPLVWCQCRKGTKPRQSNLPSRKGTVAWQLFHKRGRLCYSSHLKLNFENNSWLLPLLHGRYFPRSPTGSKLYVSYLLTYSDGKCSLSP